MADVHPIGHRDPSGHWHNEELAYDGNLDTGPSYDPLPEGEWSEWLILEYPRSYAVAVQWNWPIGSITADSEFVSYDGEKQVAWQLWRVSDGHIEQEGEPPHGFVDSVWWRFRHYGEQPAIAGPSELPLWALCSGPLAPICMIVHDTADWFDNLADEIADVMFVGDALAAPFRALADILHDLGNTCCEVSVALQDILDALQEGVTWEAILGLIQEHAPDLYGLITDPVGWFLVKLTLAFDLEPWHTQSLEFLAKWVLEEYFPVLYHLWLDPDAWIEEHITPLIPTLPDWLADPVGWLTSVLQEHFPTLYAIYEDPDAWLRERVLNIIQELTEDIGEFLDNAWAWLLDRYEDAFEGISARLYYLTEHTLRYFWEGEW